jgi:SAM-dependent methyltransferase
MSKLSHQRDWEDLAGLDPLWAIMSAPEKRYSRWQHSQFFATGQAEVAETLAWTQRHGLPSERRDALDFGCGVGRLTRALAEEFDMCVGVDISPAMVAQARELNVDVGNISFAVGDQDELPTGPFDFVLTLIVLHHLRLDSDIQRAIAALSARIRPGGALVLGVTSHLPRRHRIQPRPRLYTLLRSLGVDAELLYRKFALTPIRIRAIGDADMRTLLAENGLEVVDVRETTHDSGVRSAVYLATRR